MRLRLDADGLSLLRRCLPMSRITWRRILVAFLPRLLLSTKMNLLLASSISCITVERAAMKSKGC